MGHLLKSQRRFAAAGPDMAIIPQLDPRLRVVLAALFACALVAMSHLWALLAGFGMAGAMLMMAGMPLGKTLRRMLALDGFIIFAICTLPFTTPGTPVAALFGFPISEEGIVLAIDILLTANAIILTLMALVGSMEAVTLGHALRHLRVPERFVHLMLFSIRYMDVLRDEYHRLRDAMRVRGFRARFSLHSLRSLGYLVGMMLVRAMERSERILDAMKCRGFTGTFPLIDNMRLKPRDHIFALVFIAVLGGLMIWDATYALN